MKNVLMVYCDWARRPDESYGGCGYIRIFQPGSYLQKLCSDEFNVEIAGRLTDEKESWTEMWSRIWSQYDLVVMHNPGNPAALQQILISRDFMQVKMGLNKKLIFDYDDYYFGIDEMSPCYLAYHPNSDSLKIAEAAMRSADALTVTTPELIARYSTINKNCYLLPNCVDPGYWDCEKYRADIKIDKKEGEVRLGWWGSATHYSDIKEIMPALEEIMASRKNVKFVCVGQPADFFANLHKDDRIEYHSGEIVFSRWPAYANSLGIDLAIAPLKKSIFNSCKSPVKYFEYSCLKIPAVYSKYKGLPYERVVIHGKTGYLALNTRDWIKYLIRLIDNEGLRKEIGLAAFNDMERWHIKNNVHKWADVYQKVLSIPIKKRELVYA